jgi:hypothetical protein
VGVERAGGVAERSWMPMECITWRFTGRVVDASHSSPIPRRANGSIIDGRLKLSTATIVLSSVSDAIR